MSNKYRVSEFAKKINRAPSTLRRWDIEGRLPAKRTASGQRYYEDSDLYHALGLEPPAKMKKTIVYCRVSSKGQAADLRSQVEAMRLFCLGAGLAVDEWIEEFGSGMNFNRKQFLALFEQIEARQVKLLLLAHKDRLVRFGFDFFERFASLHGCTITVVNQEALSPKEEMVSDLMDIVHCFSSRLYGLRSYKKQIRQAAQSDE